jgi:hypothetical protein
MLTDLVALSHNIERYIAENPIAASGGNQSSPNQRALKAEEIERVVRRVEVHFKARIDELDRIVQEQKEVILQLSREREMWKRRAEAGGEASSSKRHDGDVASDAATPRDTAKDVQHLRQTLAEEKRQRLLVEEQTQHLTEQHTKVVNTLEQRIRKQEKQLQSMVEVFEQHGSSNSGGGNSNGNGTPRSLKFRQQRQLRFDDHPPTPDRTTTTTAAAGGSSSELVQQQLQSSTYLRSGVGHPTDDVTDVIDISGKSSPLDPTVPASTVLPLEVDADMDDVAAFLANISKELESISSVEAQRQNKIAALSY